MVDRLVLVVESPLSLRDRKRYGVDQLRKLGFSVEIWEVCNWILSRSSEQWHVSPGDLKVHSISNVDEFRQRARRLTERDTVILVGIGGFPIGPERSALLRCLFDTPARLGSVIVGNRPSSGRHWEWLYRYLHRARAYLRGARGFRRKLDYVWVDTSMWSVDKDLIGSNTLIRYIHALDVDLLDGLERKVAEVPYALILDSMGSLHPDCRTLEMPNPWLEGCYEEMAARTIHQLNQRGIPVVVAAHPRAAPGTIDHMYPGAEVYYERTPQLLSQASFVLTFEGSTTVGIAAMLEVPVIFLKAKCQSKYVRKMMMSFCRALNTRPQDIDSLGTIALPPPINRNAYARYVKAYVKRPGTPSGHFWRVVGNHLLELNS